MSKFEELSDKAMSLVGPQVKEEFGLDTLGFGWVMLKLFGEG